jgi:hypothetical protein
MAAAATPQRTAAILAVAGFLFLKLEPLDAFQNNTCVRV